MKSTMSPNKGCPALHSCLFKVLNSFAPARIVVLPTLLVLLLASGGSAQGFVQTPMAWTVPIGGAWEDSSNRGYEFTNNIQRIYTGAHVEYWSTMDMNADGFPDLVVTMNDSAGTGTFGLPDHPHWRVFLGSATGFGRQYIPWALPRGGHVNFGNNVWGYFYPEAVDGVPTINLGTQAWTTRDMDGDSRPDLVVTGEVVASDHLFKVFGLGTAPYWKCYHNNGAGFDTVAVHWPVPVGGPVYNGTEVGYSEEFKAYVRNSNQVMQAWLMLDMTGDGLEDLVVTAQNNLPDTKMLPFGGASPYWKVFQNNGNGFNTTPISWDLPIGGFTFQGQQYNYPTYSRDYLGIVYADDHAWDVKDINGDAKPDLILTAHDNPGASATVFGHPNTPHWRVHLNNGNGFNPSYSQWNLPAGGLVRDGNSVGYVETQSDLAIIYDGGSQNWDLIDMDADGDRDLVVQSELLTTYSGVYDVQTAPYWKVYLNSNNAFAANPIVWYVPQTGCVGSCDWLGCSFTSVIAGMSMDAGSQSYDLRDMNGDGRPDIVVTGELRQSNDVCAVWDPTTFPYWRVYLNTAASVGTPETVEASGVAAFPNPATEQLHIEAGYWKGKATLYNLQGQLLQTADLQPGQTLTLPVTGYARGTYLLQIVHGSGTVTMKVVFQ